EALVLCRETACGDRARAGHSARHRKIPCTACIEQATDPVGQRYMTINHHPSDETLMRMASGTLSAGPALVVAVHLEGCAVCRDRMATFEAIGGAILEEMPPAQLAADLLGRTMERLEAAQPLPSKDPTMFKLPELGIEFPQAMQNCEVGPWKWLGPG